MEEGETPEEFFARHCALGPSHVVLAIIVTITPSGASDDRHGIFSTLENAEAWSAKHEGTTIFAPYIIDVPEFGERPTRN